MERPGLNPVAMSTRVSVASPHVMWPSTPDGDTGERIGALAIANETIPFTKTVCSAERQVSPSRPRASVARH